MTDPRRSAMHRGGGGQGASKLLPKLNQLHAHASGHPCSALADCIVVTGMLGHADFSSRAVQGMLQLLLP